MKRKKHRVLFIFLACLVGGYYCVYPIVPSLFLKIHESFLLQNLKVQLKTIRIGNENVEYVEGGKGETLLFIHGFKGEKFSWYSYLKKLRPHFHVIAIDLPGHGGSSYDPNHSHDMFCYAKDVDQFIEQKGLKQFHLLGTSMGGGIAVIYASTHAEKVKSLILINPLGVQQAEKSELLKKLDCGKNLFFPETGEELDELACCLVGKPFGKGSFQTWLALKKINCNKIFYEKVFQELLKTNPLDPLLPNVRIPSLLLYGDADRVIPPNSFLIFQKGLPQVIVKRYEKAPHVFCGPFLDRAAKDIKSFIGKKNPQKAERKA